MIMLYVASIVAVFTIWNLAVYFLIKRDDT